MKPQMRISMKQKYFNEENNSLNYKWTHKTYEISWKDALKREWGKLIAWLCVLFLSIGLLIISCKYNWGVEGILTSIVGMGVSSFGILFWVANNVIDQCMYVDIENGEIHYNSSHKQYMINKYVPSLLIELELSDKQEEEKAMIWRAAHPLEEKCRLALTKNPNYVADLIKYVKENNK